MKTWLQVPGVVKRCRKRADIEVHELIFNMYRVVVEEGQISRAPH